MFKFLEMAINETFPELTELFDIKKSPEHRTIISPDGDVLTPVSPYCASRILDSSQRNLKDDDPLFAKTTEGNDCYVVYFEPKGTQADDWSHTQIALIENRGVSGLHMGFVELSSSDGHVPNTAGLTETVFVASAIITPPSKILSELLYPIHYRDFNDDGFFDLSISQLARAEFFARINECAGKVPLTRPEELASDSAQYTGELYITKQTSQQIQDIQNRVTADNAARKLKATVEQSVNLN